MVGKQNLKADVEAKDLVFPNFMILTLGKFINFVNWVCLNKKSPTNLTYLKLLFLPSFVAQHGPISIYRMWKESPEAGAVVKAVTVAVVVA